jgi:predicted nucleic acid-binding protein
MTKMPLAQALAGVRQIMFDTPPVIYFVEANPQYDAVVAAVFQQVDQGILIGVTSLVTLVEVLTGPLRVGNQALAQRYRDLLTGSTHFYLQTTITLAESEQAAEFRARYNLKTPDALQIAIGLSAGSDVFLTNDGAFKRINEMKVLVLDELEL